VLRKVAFLVDSMDFSADVFEKLSSRLNGLDGGRCTFLLLFINGLKSEEKVQSSKFFEIWPILRISSKLLVSPWS